MKLRLWNETKQRWIRDADSDSYAICEFDFYSDAVEALKRVNDLKMLNPNNRGDVIKIVCHATKQPKDT